MKCISLFEKLTGAIVKDCVIEEGKAIFVVKEGDMGKAIGKGGSTIDKVRKAFGMNISVVEHAESPEKFIENIFMPVKPSSLSIRDGTAFVNIDSRDRGSAIGRNGEKIKTGKTLLERHFKMDLKLVTRG